MQPSNVIVEVTHEMTSHSYDEGARTSRMAVTICERLVLGEATAITHSTASTKLDIVWFASLKYIPSVKG